MPVLISILGVGITAAVAASVWSISNRRGDPIDPADEEQWLVAKLASQPRIAAFMRRRLDPTKTGGLLLTAGFVLVLALGAVAGAVFDMITAESGIARWDEAFAEWGAANATSATTRIMQLVTELGGTPLVVAVAAVVGAVETVRTKNWHVAWFLTAVVAGQSLVNNGLKWLIERDRPAVEQLVGHAGSSFPSGHAAAAAATWAAVALVVGRGRSRRARIMLGAGAAAIAVAVAATRVLLGVHWLTDVVAGLAVGWGWFVIVAVAFGGRLQWFGAPQQMVNAEVTGGNAHA